MMDRRFASRMGAIAAPASMEMARRAREMRAHGMDVVDFSTGDPDWATPDHIVKAAWDALKSGFTHYGPASGDPELLAAIATDYNMRHGAAIEPAGRIVVTPGAKQAVLDVLLALIEPGDEVLIPSPCWLSYGDMVRLAGGRPVFVAGDEGRGFRCGPEELAAAVTSATRAVIINSPCNPTGAVWSGRDLDGVAEVARRHGLWVISDETYERIVYDGIRSESIATRAGMEPVTFVINSFSKTYAMTGWRIGYVIGPPDMMEAVMRVHQNSATCTAPFVQRAALAALKGPQECVAEMVAEYQARRDMLLRVLGGVAGVRCLPVKGTFYLFVDIRGLGMDSVEAAEYFLEKAAVVMTPGSAYGPGGEGYLRISFAVSRETAARGVERLVEAVKRRGKE